MHSRSCLLEKILAAFYFTFLLITNHSGNHAQADNLPLLNQFTQLIQNLFPNKPIIHVNYTSANNHLPKCFTAGCNRTASIVKSYLDENVHPCENFYKFACGNYIKKTEIPEGKEEVNIFGSVQNLVNVQLSTVLSEPSQPNESKSFRLAKTFYSSCLNETYIEEHGLQLVADILKELGGWPVVDGDSWLENEFDWVETTKKFRRMGFGTDGIFSLRIETDLKNSTRRVLIIDQTDRELSAILMSQNKKMLIKYFELMATPAIVFNASAVKAYKEMVEALKFEGKLVKISMSGLLRRNRTAMYNPFTIQKLQEAYPYLNWLNYINSFLPNSFHVTESEVVINQSPKYFQQLQNILSSTPKRTIANYLLWRAAITSGAFTQKMRFFFKQKAEPRWNECSQLTAEKFKTPVNVLYVRRYFDESSRQVASDLVKDVRLAFINSLHAVPWMDDLTREKAIHKANSSLAYIGYHSELDSQFLSLEEKYKDLEMEPDNFITNNLRINKFTIDTAFSLLRKPVNKTGSDSTMTNPATVNAYYVHNENAILLSAAFLQDPIFSADRPNYVNYARMGSIIGHEFTHGFDDKGRQFDFNGDLFNWWYPDAEKRFLEKSKCIIQQYGRYRNLNLRVNGLNTLGENIADNGGIKEAYYAYKNWVEQNGPENVLPELNYDQQELFWISFAQTWCSKSKDDYSRLTINTKIHSPHEFRVNGPISNMPKSTFAKDFNCAVGTKMNPIRKCTVW